MYNVCPLDFVPTSLPLEVNKGLFYLKIWSLRNFVSLLAADWPALESASGSVANKSTLPKSAPLDVDKGLYYLKIRYGETISFVHLHNLCDPPHVSLDFAPKAHPSM